MIKQHEEPIQKMEKVIDEVLCNKCGQPIKKKMKWGLVPHTAFMDYLEVIKIWDSRLSLRPDHGERFHICENCYNEFIASFIIEPERIGLADMPAVSKDFLEECKRITQKYFKQGKEEK